MIERRETHRSRTLLGGWIRYGRQHAPFRCVVRNLSPEGAKLAFSASMVVPAEIELTIAAREATRRARIVWREGDAAGVAFLDSDSDGAPSPDRAPIPLDLVRRRRASETEAEALRARLTALGEEP